MPEAPVKKPRKARHITDEMLAAAAILVANDFSIMRAAALLHVGRSSLSRRLKLRAAHARRGTTGKKSAKKTATMTEVTATAETPFVAPVVSVATETLAALIPFVQPLEAAS